MAIARPKRWHHVATLVLSLLLTTASASVPLTSNSPVVSTVSKNTERHTARTHRRRQHKKTSTLAKSTPFLPTRGGNSNALVTLRKEVIGASYFCVFDVLLSKLFRSKNIAFPSMMAGCVLLFAFMLLVDVVRPGWGDVAFDVLNPGATFLVKWMGVMFVPGLVLLPLAPEIGNGVEVAKFLATIIIGFYFSIFTITYSTLGIRALQGQLAEAEDDDVNIAAKKAFEKGKMNLLRTAGRIAKEGQDAVLTATKQGKDATIAAASEAAKKGKDELLSAASEAAKEAQDSVTKAAFKQAEKQLLPKPPTGGQTATKPYSKEMVTMFAQGALFFGASTVYATLIDHPSVAPLRMLFMMCTSVGAFVFGARLPKSVTKIVHPLVTSTLLTLVMNYVTALMTKQTFMDLLKTYKTSSLSPTSAGAGDYLLFALGPAVIALAVPMYSRKKLMADNMLAVLVSTIVSSVGGLYSTAAIVRLLTMASSVIRLSLLTRNVTTALAIPITKMLEGDMSVCACVCVLTGIFGATVGAPLLTSVGVTDPVSRGLGIGGAAFALGAASIVGEKDAFPFAAISMVTTAVCSTCVVSVPFLREGLISLAVGSGDAATIEVPPVMPVLTE